MTRLADRSEVTVGTAHIFVALVGIEVAQIRRSGRAVKSALERAVHGGRELHRHGQQRVGRHVGNEDRLISQRRLGSTEMRGPRCLGQRRGASTRDRPDRLTKVDIFICNILLDVSGLLDASSDRSLDVGLRVAHTVATNGDPVERKGDGQACLAIGTPRS